MTSELKRRPGKKDLYLANSLGELNKLAEFKQKVLNAKIYVKSAEKVFRSAEDHAVETDEEKAYVLYMKFFNIIACVKKTSDYRKNEKFYRELIGTANLIKAINEAEILSKSLKERYDEREAIEVAKKFQAKSNDDDANRRFELSDDDEDSDDADVNKVTEKDKKVGDDVPPGAITAKQLYKLLIDNSSKVVIIDTRSTDQYQLSRMNHHSCINVPADIIPPGTTVKYIEQSMPKPSKSLWNERESADYIVLFDWSSTIDSLKVGVTLQSLKDALYKWDSKVRLKKEPLILDGGYEAWLLFYPTMSTNPDVQKPTFNTGPASPILSLVDLDYPDLEATFTPKTNNDDSNTSIETLDNAFIETPQTPFNGDDASHLNNSSGGGGVSTHGAKPNVSLFPHVDRNLKPKMSNRHVDEETTAEKTMDEVDLEKFIQNDSTPSIPKIDRSNKPSRIENSEISAPPKSKILIRAEKIANDIQTLNKLKRDKQLELSEYMKENDKVIAEQKIRLDQLKNEQEKMEKLQTLRQQEEKDLASLMREKKRISDLIATQKNSYELQRKLAEDETARRNAEIEAVKEEEKAKKKQQEEVNKLRELKPEDAAANKGPSTSSGADVAALTPGHSPTEPTSLDSAVATHDKHEEIRKAAEELSLKEQKRDSDNSQTPNNQDQPGSAVDSRKAAIGTELPSGWERVYDHKSKRYIYIDHATQTTHWNPPVKKTRSGSPSGTVGTSRYEKLKDEPAAGTGAAAGAGTVSGMRRASSSPNIARLAADDETASVPTVDRSAKPSDRSSLNNFHADQLINMQPTYGSVEGGLTGLRNLGNTCYMNSIIQSLNNTAPLVTYFLSGNYSQHINRENILGCQGELAKEFATVVKALWSGKYSHFSPRDFKSIVGKHKSVFAGYQQQDSQEFLIFLLDGLHEDMNIIRKRPQVPQQDNENIPDVRAADIAWKVHKLLNESIIVELFQGQFRSSVQCLKCHKKSVTFETFMYLSLPLPPSTRCSLQDCLKLFLKEEKMVGASKWFCPRCKVRREAVKKIDIWKLPIILLIHLKRFSYDGSWHQKLNTSVDFTLTGLNMRGYIRGNRIRPDYHLYAVSNHYGTMEGGHYTAFCRNPVTRSWFKFDDQDVYPISTSDIKSSAAYILFYSSIDMQPPVI
ncbi:ubiquitin carboxyl-terminal hydrolase 8-like isoform X2 [Tubulanus polymorphus]|uniref:ubiquitin carboxyl-terminal hydrolase 8-like isoform X2 n=1 Tax=Tubulanus polymorphus TaxID=672921 RepID=UPI003DA5830B